MKQILDQALTHFANVVLDSLPQAGEIRLKED